MILASGLLGFLAARSEILFADGLRYVEQARRIDHGALADGLVRSVDHPAYPLAIAAIHRALGLGDGPRAWQASAQGASVLAGVLLVIPLYLVAVELFGGGSAWLACVLAYAAPTTGHVLADTLSEGTFLLFWMWGLWAALRFLKAGTFGWLPTTIGFAALGVPESARGAAPAGGDGGLPRLDAPPALDPPELAEVVGGGRVPGDRPDAPDRPLCGDERWTGDEAGGREIARHRAEVGG